MDGDPWTRSPRLSAPLVQPRLQREQAAEERLGVVPRARVRRLLVLAARVWIDRRRSSRVRRAGVGVRRRRGSVVEDGVVQLVDRKRAAAVVTPRDLVVARSRHQLIVCSQFRDALVNARMRTAATYSH